MFLRAKMSSDTTILLFYVIINSIIVNLTVFDHSDLKFNLTGNKKIYSVSYSRTEFFYKTSSRVVMIFIV